MKKLLIIISILLLLPSTGNAQLWKIKRYELSGSIGTTQFYGDIGGYSPGDNLLGIKDFTFHNTRYNITGNLRYKILQNVSVRLNLAFGSFHSTDIKGSNENRKFESRTLFFEPALLGEFYFIKNKSENSFLFIKGDKTAFVSIFQSLDFYTFTGFGGLVFKVKPNDRLEPLATKLNGFTPVIPLGVGVKMNYSANINFGIELGARYTFSDRIDGYTSQYSKANDMYHFLNFNVTYKISTGPKGGPQFKRKLSFL
jgi:hypothetical protein